jgi:hypothetical protein
MVFVRVLGDLRIEFDNPLRSPVEQLDVELFTGSGFVIAPSGLILTSDHVVSAESLRDSLSGRGATATVEVKRIEVAVGPGGRYGLFEAWVGAADSELDLAVLQVTAADLPYVPFGDSDALDPGRPVQALGFPFGRRTEVGRSGGAGLAPDVTVTAGSLSAARADEEGETRYLQTDAAVHPGSSGGPMVDGEGYAVAVVRMKLAGSREAPGAGFGVPINLVKDFLELHGFASQLPAIRLYPGVRHTMEWKGLQMELPDGFEDESLRRLRVEAGDWEGRVLVRAYRVVTPLEGDELEEALLRGDGLEGFVPAAATRMPPGAAGAAAPVRLGSAVGQTAEGVPFRVEYGVSSLGRETVVARYLGSPEDLAFNLSLIRRSLGSLDAVPLLSAEASQNVRVGFVPIAAPGLLPGAEPLPEGWVLEPANQAACAALPPAASGVAASPAGDFTLVFRLLRWERRPPTLDDALRRCGRGPWPDPTYGFFEDRLGARTGVFGTFVERPGEILLLEAEAPEAKLPFLRDLYVEWLGLVAQ